MDNNSALCPPNSRWLSDRGIGHVAEAANIDSFGRVPSSAAQDNYLRFSSIDTCTTSSSSAASNGQEDTMISTQRANISRSLEHQVVRRPPIHGTTQRATLRVNYRLAEEERRRRDNTSRSLSNAQQNDQVEEEAAQNERRRQRNRIHQARHIMKKRRIVEDLEEATKRLREEVSELHFQRRVALAGVPATSTMWHVAAEYFQLFRKGFNSQGNRFNGGLLQPRESHVQRNFLQATMAPDVLVATGCGVEALLEDWRLISLVHEDFDIQLVRLEHGSEESMTATTKFRVAISAGTIQYAFPHLTKDEAESRALCSKLLGKILEFRGVVHFGWDGKSCRVQSMEYSADILTPMLKLLNTLENVLQVFDGALIDLDCNFVARVG